MSGGADDGEGRRTGGGVDASVIIATRDRASMLRQTLEGLARQELGGRSWEVIVVDNGSTDETPHVLAAARAGLPLTTLHEPRPGKNRALNGALPHASGRLLIFTDDDVRADPRWIRTLLEAADRWPDDNLFGGRIDPVFPSSSPAWLRDPSFEHRRWAFTTYAPRPDEGPTAETPLGPNLAIRAGAMPPEGFDESIGPRGGPAYAMGSEVELMLRLYRRGEQFIYVPDARVDHVLLPGHVELASLKRRARRCGRGNARLFGSPPTYPLLGIPLHQWRRLAEASGRFAVTRLAGVEARQTATLTLHQVRGNVREQLAMMRETRRRDGARAWRILPSPATVLSAVRNYRLTGIAARGFRWATAPVARVEGLVMYEADLASQAQTNRTPPATIEVFRDPRDEAAVRRRLTRLGLIGPETIQARLDAGGMVAIASIDGEPVGFAWSALDDVLITELDLTLAVAPDEIVGIDGYVVPEYRGLGLLRHLDQALMQEALRAGRSRQLIYTTIGNRPVRASMKRAGKSEVLTYARLTLPWLGRSWEVRNSDPELTARLFRRPSPPPPASRSASP